MLAHHTYDHAGTASLAAPFANTAEMSVVPPSLLLCVVALSIAGMGINGFALALMNDLQRDYINAYSFVDRLNRKLVTEALVHVPMLICWIGCGGAGAVWHATQLVPIMLTLALGGLRFHWSRRRDLMLDVTTVFTEREQRLRRRRWIGAILSHAILLMLALTRFFTLVPVLDFERLRQANEHHAAVQAELRDRIASGNATLSHILAHSMMHPGLFAGMMGI
eukprot:CAMPEP_0119355624 /NCGR_PEP_ID=MMETSP1334-20130426/4428_1 /TAXON_ID=127549 /ORGANISM="Calcidiscus leptoporus, Strain RCC1130" /LENGTH=221 /DNA_ID=CAMNT_0007369485 /DNA_START=353 /DNA_END=1018 /DNA_ORIENTATION=-